MTWQVRHPQDAMGATVTKALRDCELLFSAIYQYSGLIAGFLRVGIRGGNW